MKTIVVIQSEQLEQIGKVISEVLQEDHVYTLNEFIQDSEKIYLGYDTMSTELEVFLEQQKDTVIQPFAITEEFKKCLIMMDIAKAAIGSSVRPCICFSPEDINNIETIKKRIEFEERM